MPTPSSTATAPGLSRDHQDFLVELAVAIQKRAFYPTGHPMLHGAVDGAWRRATALLEDEASLAIGVAERRLIMQGVPTDDGHPLLSELAGRLAAHLIGAIRIQQGITREEIDDFLEVVSAPVDDEAGTRTAYEGRWSHLHVERLSFERLGLLGEGSDSGRAPTADSAWQALASLALSGESSGDLVTDPGSIALAIDRRAGDAAFDAEVLEKLAELVGGASIAGAQGSVRKERVADLVASLSAEARERLLQSAGAGRGVALVRDSLGSLGARAVVDLLRAASGAEGLGISTSMLRLLEKMSSSAGRSAPWAADADRILRRTVKRLLDGWTLEDPNPELYTRALSEAALPDAGRARDRQRDHVDPDRLIDLALETGVINTSVQSALGRLALRDGLGPVLERLQQYPESEARDVLIDRLLNEASLREYLAQPVLDVPLLRQAVDRLRTRAFEPLYDALERRGDGDAPALIELIVRIGWDVLEPLGMRVDTATVRLMRHLIAIFDELEAWPPQAEPEVYARHPDVLVRREAIKYLLRTEATREQGVAIALRDTDLRVFALGLAAITREGPPAFVRDAMRRYEDPGMTTELRVRVIRAVGASPLPDVAPWLAGLALTRRWIIGSARLRKPTAESIAAVQALAGSLAETTEGRLVMALAAESKVGEYRRAVRRHTRSTHT